MMAATGHTPTPASSSSSSAAVAAAAVAARSLVDAYGFTRSLNAAATLGTMWAWSCVGAGGGWGLWR
jgi:hypothetical protein